MAKRFTDISKWRNPWFRSLSQEAKLAWIYLCDECNHAGIWKADYDLASFQLSFLVNEEKFLQWFGDKLHFFDLNKILIIPFFEFQYGETKDTWSAKITARKHLENLGFNIKENKVFVDFSTHCPPTVGGESKTLLIKGKGKGVFVFKKGECEGEEEVGITPTESFELSFSPSVQEFKLYLESLGFLKRPSIKRNISAIAKAFDFNLASLKEWVSDLVESPKFAELQNPGAKTRYFIYALKKETGILGEKND